MQNQIDSKPNKLLSFFISLIIVVDGFSAFVVGRVYLSYISNPVHYDVKTGEDLVYAKVTAWLTFAYFLLCLISLVCWLLGNTSWKYVILVLGLLPFFGSSYILIIMRRLSNEYNLVRSPFYGFLAINLLLFVFIIFDIVKSRFIFQKGNDNAVR